MPKTDEQREAARQRRLLRQAKARGEPVPKARGVSMGNRVDISRDAASFDPTDYSAKGGFKRTQRWVLALIEELEQMVEGPVSDEVSFTDVGNLAAVRVHLEKSIAHMKGTGACGMCPTLDMPQLRKHWKT